jgi:hypothetical protein
MGRVCIRPSWKGVYIRYALYRRFTIFPMGTVDTILQGSK